MRSISDIHYTLTTFNNLSEQEKERIKQLTIPTHSIMRGMINAAQRNESDLATHPKWIDSKFAIATNANGLIIGWCLRAPALYLNVADKIFAFVTPYYRRQGIGKRLAHMILETTPKRLVGSGWNSTASGFWNSIVDGGEAPNLFVKNW